MHAINVQVVAVTLVAVVASQPNMGATLALWPIHLTKVCGM